MTAAQGPSKGVAASVLTDSNGTWIAGTSRKLVGISVAATELWAFRDGLSLAWDMGFGRIILESDAKMVLHLLHSPPAHSILIPLLDMCRNLLNQMWKARLQEIYREANRVADCLAKSATSQDIMFTLFDAAPAGF